MENKDKLINILEEDPELYKIINSKEIMQILEQIKTKPQKKEEITRKIYFKKVSILYNILDILIKKKIIKKIDIENKEIYYITDKGNEFMDLCYIAKKKYNI
ncbi:MAG: winged helix-turn-helix domain-containing protein [Candidatus ainarchaeum sp.]|nr:winged helix-turn-helix domain-containing protein [Candidatus ainarchaeum sp.]MDD3975849.1 winged helix-turn-helix domain-containing protein [Candidatus ainarchaeum sp.]